MIVRYINVGPTVNNNNNNYNSTHNFRETRGIREMFVAWRLITIRYVSK